MRQLDNAERGLAIGRARQELEWIAKESDAWIWHGITLEKLGDIVNTLKELGDGETWKPFGVANFVELLEDPNIPTEFYNNIYLRGGAKGIVEFWQQRQADGVAHIIVNLKSTRRGALETIQDFTENVIPHFAV
jgi:bacterial luciferase family protein